MSIAGSLATAPSTPQEFRCAADNYSVSALGGIATSGQLMADGISRLRITTSAGLNEADWSRAAAVLGQVIK